MSLINRGFMQVKFLLSFKTRFSFFLVRLYLTINFSYSFSDHKVRRSFIQLFNSVSEKSTLPLFECFSRLLNYESEIDSSIGAKIRIFQTRSNINKGKGIHVRDTIGVA